MDMTDHRSADPARTVGGPGPDYVVDNRHLVIGPLPKAAPPVLGDWDAIDPSSDTW